MGSKFSPAELMVLRPKQGRGHFLILQAKYHQQRYLATYVTARAEQVPERKAKLSGGLHV